jgi:hypothetical protein
MFGLRILAAGYGPVARAGGRTGSLRLPPTRPLPRIIMPAASARLRTIRQASAWAKTRIFDALPLGALIIVIPFEAAHAQTANPRLSECSVRVGLVRVPVPNRKSWTRTASCEGKPVDPARR